MYSTEQRACARVVEFVVIVPALSVWYGVFSWRDAGEERSVLERRGDDAAL